MSKYRIRAHHGMCLAYFVGEGYSSSFVENMFKQKKYLETKNPLVEVIVCADTICSKCPNNKNGVCTSLDKVKEYDLKVLEVLNLEEGTEMLWSTYSYLVHGKILKKGKRKEICEDCRWNGLCEEIGKNM